MHFFCAIVLHLRFGQGAFVHFLVLVERDSINLHRYGWHHIRRLLIHDKRVKRTYINLPVADNICCYELASAIGVIKGLHRSILDAVKLTDHRFHLFEFDAETANLHLTVLTPDELYRTVLTVTNYITCAIDAQAVVAGSPESVFRTERHKRISRLLRLVEVTYTYLRTCHQQFARCTPRQTFAALVRYIQVGRIVRVTDRDVRLVFLHPETGYIHGTLRRSVRIQQFVTRRIHTHHFFSACTQVLQSGYLRIVDHHLSSHLGGHEDVCYTLFHEIVVQLLQIKAYIVAYHIHRTPCAQATPHIVHERIKAVTGVRCIPALGRETYMANMEIAETQYVLLAQHHTLRDTCCTGCIEQNERIFAVVSGGVGTHELQSLRRITAVQRHSGHSGFRYRQRHNHHLFVARNGIAYHVLTAANGVLRINAIRQPVHLGVRETHIAGYDTDSVRLSSHVLLEALNQRVILVMLHRVTLFCFRILLVQPSHLLGIAVVDVLHRLCTRHRA